MDSSLSTIDQYRVRIHHLEDRLKSIQQKLTLFSLIRLFVFLGIVITAYYYYRWEYPAILLFTILAGIILFLWAVHRHTDIRYDHTIVKNLIKINQNEITILSQKPSFLTDGSFYHEEYSYSADLDIFGPRSLYHMINRCFSEPGRQMLANWFIKPGIEGNVIQERQAAVEVFREKVEHRQLLLAHGLAHFNDDTDRFYPNKPLIKASIYRRIQLLRWLPLLITLLTIGAAVLLHTFTFVLYGFLLNIVLTGLFLKTTMKVILVTDRTLKNLTHYKEPLRILIRTDHTNGEIQERKEKLRHIYDQLSTLRRRFNLLESRSNLLVGLLLNGFLGFDFIAISLLKRWYDSNASNIPNWLDEIAWFEAIFSLSTFAYNNPHYTFPLLNRTMGIKGQNIRHPFIPDESNVGNSIDFIPPLKVILLTGSNMSGKSTFLRSLGVNQALALAGSVVAADIFHSGLYDIMTSFRKADSIQEHTSLFYDELKKLQYIMASLKDPQRPTLILLDEILRGTNSDDKNYGSRQVLLRLKDDPAMTILATHDIALAQLEENHGSVIQNYSFESQIIDDELQFDYQLHRGVAVNKNATYLMEKMGIIFR